ncbi:4'-phosphopantetheinyl transferase family protein [Cognatilysobacter segetis]|uniref:4'-phosphopantetheinyl transferase family protein n=1 Tax=Cognatilysobacter segetis TaxID=2492394 RepID=UPI0010605E56|nr:4'-phosphopantetheinyl transferase superfamily protein [Lysobacter segetis]
MPHAPSARSSGPVEVAVLPHPAGVPAEALARDWLASALGLAPARIGFARAPHGRPTLQVDDRDSDWDCNWSHSGGRLAIALGVGLRVGIDIERPRARPRAVELARRFFTPAEAEALAALPEPAREPAFLRLWCAKEAVLKAHGRGLAFGLDRLRFEGLASTPRLVAADATLGRPAAWTIEAVPADGLVGMLAWCDRAALP